MAFAAGRWRSRWIWADGTDGAGRHAVALRTTATLDVVPAVAPARAVAISRYALWVNGVEVARGPARTNPRSLRYDALDLAPYLSLGQNVIAAIALRYEGPTPWYLPPPDFSTDLTGGAFAFELDLGDDDWVVSDETWQATALAGWTAERSRGVSGRGRELLDASGLPAGWDVAGDAAAQWPGAIVRRAMAVGEPGPAGPPSYPGGPFEARPHTAPRPVDVALAASGDGRSHTTDRVVVGTVALDVDGPVGSEVVVRVAEMLDADEAPAPSEHDASIGFTLDGSRRTLESFDLYGLRGAVVESPDGVTVHGLRVRERVFPVEGDAFFGCSDPVLNDIWAIGRRTVSICSLDAYIDCPTREQRAWTGDAVVHQLVDLTTNADWSLARWHPKLTASPRADGMLPMAVAGDVEHFDYITIPDWALHWVHSVWNLYRYVGDPEEIAPLLQVAEGVVRWFTRWARDDGLLVDVPGWVIIDWSAVYTRGVSSALNGLWARALLELAEMSSWLGDEGRARWARATHERVRGSFESLWDPERARYVDSMVGGESRPMASQHGQAAALVGGLVVDADRIARLVEVLTDRSQQVDAAFGIDGPATPDVDQSPGGALRTGHPGRWWDVDLVVRAQPFFRYVVHDALAAAGRADLIAGACLDWTDALVRCDTSWTETWYGGTVCHGWSSTPTRDLMQRVLGVTPAEPGFTVARVEPALGELEWARGRVPTPAGSISIEVTRDGVEIDSPIPVVRG